MALTEKGIFRLPRAAKGVVAATHQKEDLDRPKKGIELGHAGYKKKRWAAVRRKRFQLEGAGRGVK